MRTAGAWLTSVALLVNVVAVPLAALLLVVDLFSGMHGSSHSVRAATLACCANVALLCRASARTRTADAVRLGALACNLVTLIGMGFESPVGITNFSWHAPAFFPWGPLLAAIPAYALGAPRDRRPTGILFSGAALFAAWFTWMSAQTTSCPPNKRIMAASDIMEIDDALLRFKRAADRYPTTEEGLTPLFTACSARKTGCELPGLRLDPWGNPYFYRNDGGQITITSFGADGQPGGSGHNADISSRELIDYQPSSTR